MQRRKGDTRSDIHCDLDAASGVAYASAIGFGIWVLVLIAFWSWKC